MGTLRIGILRKDQINYKGEQITKPFQLKKPEFGTGRVNSDGYPEVAWPQPSETVDNYGFDKKNVESNSHYTIKIKLPPGTIIIRYGREDGHFTAPKGTEYEKLSLPYVKETVPYFEYRVKKRIIVKCKVTKGKAAPAFDSEGGAIQYYHPITIGMSLQKGILERIRRGGKRDEGYK